MAVMPTDPNSPTYNCDMAAWLREQYYRLMSGGGEKVIRYKGPKGEREVQFTQANLAELKAELQKFEGLCAASTDPNAPPRRFAIRGGSSLRRGQWG
jgi:hypothetical protein